MAAALPHNASIDIDPFIVDDTHWIDFSYEGLTLDGEAEVQPGAKRAKLDGGNSAVRKKQNREAARRSRMRKKHQESELQQKLDLYTKSNEALKKHNQELQDMLDLARYQVANLANGGTLQPVEILKDHAAKSSSCASVCDPLVPSSIEISVNDTPVDCDILPPLKRASEVSTDIHIGEFIDGLLENGDWDVNKAADINIEDPAANEVSDEGSDHLDFLLENDFWLDEDDEKKGTEHIAATSTMPITSTHTLVPQSQSVQIVSPVLSPNMKPRLHQLPCNLSRKEKNRIHARNRRMKVKMEHAHLKHSIDAYTRSNSLLKKKNKELELMLLKAHSYVAGATKGYQHYSTVFADGTACTNAASCGKENEIEETQPIDIDTDRRSSTLSESEDDDDHSLSFLWN
ncbi:hypothetical protein ACHAWO_009540 [Cyclotella atomus]|jgi:hypothetical protein|uniref:BZIP domain-containing protein n=1 Tax=Cyclotella atomus TaxID=382360 RepID=A0ABD3QZ04_9STRA